MEFIAAAVKEVTRKKLRASKFLTSLLILKEDSHGEKYSNISLSLISINPQETHSGCIHLRVFIGLLML